MNALSGKRLLLIVGGGIAAYKVLETVRRLKDDGMTIRAILTEGGAAFVTPLSLSALTGEKVYRDLFSLTDEAEMGHIRLAREADLILVAPATADLMAKMAAGLADDLASTTLLAATAPILLAPAMNAAMWENPATKRNLERLAADGKMTVGPSAGALACGETGYGRLAEPDEIVAAVRNFFLSAPRPLANKHVIVTAGPTHEPIDPVRYIANRSSGKQGFAIAAALAELGARVTLVAGPVALDTPAGADRVNVETALEMRKAVESALPADAAVLAAAVADYRPERTAAKKIKKEDGGIEAIPLAENPDILAWLSAQGPRRPRLVAGFAAETGEAAEKGARKRIAKGCDWIFANDVSAGVMGGDRNRIHMITASGVEDWEEMEKTGAARRIAQKIAETLRA